MTKLIHDPNEPASTKEALQQPQWSHAMKAELCMDNCTTAATMQGNWYRWIGGNLNKCKARDVAKGRAQQSILNFDGTFAHATRTSIMRTILPSAI